MTKKESKNIYKTTLNTVQRKHVLDEVFGKIKAYEDKMSYRLARWTEIAELHQGKTYTTQNDIKISPNSAELYKAVRAMTRMQYRMLTGQRPFFSLDAADVIGHADPYKLLKSEHYISDQLECSHYNRGLEKALTHLNLYGTTCVHSTYEPMKVNFFGRSKYVTTFRPVSLINCAFAIDGYDLESCGWVALSDIQAPIYIHKIKRADPKGEVYDMAELEKALNDNEYHPEVNMWVRQRMAWSGYIEQDFRDGREHTTYYGPLDCLYDGIEYCVEIINRKYIIRCEVYPGIRPVRIATINTLDIEPLGNGLGDQFRPLLQQLDDARSKLLNLITVAGANMWAKQKSLTDEDMQFAIRNNGILELESPETLQPIGPHPSTIQTIDGFIHEQVQDFRQASGATDTLQALVNGQSATATEVSLAMNEAVRNLSVGSELAAEVLVKEHIQLVLQNGQRYQTQPFTLTINKTPIQCMPSDLLIDTNVHVKTATDQDFRPGKITNLMNTLQLLNMIPPNALKGYQINTMPVILELLKQQDVPDFKHVISPITEEDLVRSNVIQQMTSGQNPQQPPQDGQGGLPVSPANLPVPPSSGQVRMNNMAPGRREGRAMNRMASQLPMGAITTDTLRTPVGQVLQAPGDNNLSTQTIRSSSAAAPKIVSKKRKS
jgi:hypothetical protein